MSEFIDEVSDLIKRMSKEEENVYLKGDYNVDLLKYDKHQVTSDFLDILHSTNIIVHTT